MNDFDRFSAKNAAMSRAWEMTGDKKKEEKKEYKPAEPKMGICDVCKQEALVRPHRSRQTDRTDGAASFGSVVKNYCEKCFPKSKKDLNTPPPPSAKQVKNLLKGAKKGLF
jgi:hypothetical protein